MSILKEQVACKRGVPGQKKWQPELIIAKMAVKLRLRLPLVFWTQALSHSLRGFSTLKNTLKQSDGYGCYGDIFAFREFKVTKRSRTQRA